MSRTLLREDIFVEVGWMTTAGAPPAATWTTVTNVFANLPVLNSDGSTGISIWIDRGPGGAFTGGGSVVVTRRGRPVAVLRGGGGRKMEDVIRCEDQKLWHAIEEARSEPGGNLTQEQVEAMFGVPRSRKRVRRR